MKANKRISILSLFLLGIYLLLLFTDLVPSSAVDTTAKRFLILIVLELFVFALPSFFYVKLTKDTFLKKLPLKALPKGSFFLIFSTVLLILSFGLSIGTVFYFIGIGKESYASLGPYILAKLSLSDNFLYALIAYALIPALCEEFFFRGILFLECRADSVWAATLFSSLAFAFLYFDLSAFPFYFVSGLFLAYLLRLTESLLAPIAARFFIGILSIYIMPTLWRLLTQPLGVLFAIFVSVVLFFISLYLFIKALAGYYLKLSRDPDRANDSHEPLKEGLRKSVSFLKNPIFLVAASFSLAVMIIKLFI